ncbi:MAG: hypothetical protein GX352_05190 [Clostridiales bacterium]|nr:hypothetical protein [Clostridiales bacterium]
MSEQDNKDTNAIEVQQNRPANECIRVNKVYDWIVLATERVEEIPIPVEDLEIIQGALDLGHTLTVTGTINLPDDIITEIVSVIRKVLIIDGKPIEIGCAQILKTVTLNISVFDDTNGVAPIVEFLSTFQILERAGVCFPEPFTTDNIVLNVTSADAVALSPVPINDNFLFEVGICQELQVETEVKLEVLAKFCEPRDNTINCNLDTISCTRPTYPHQCPTIFPGR